ncbi:hypothetical protein C8Q70DRAFT_957009 [Cubamyces menziesii]|nr:hypothetical protein C8Q70DRAFT_957009 [Cubamyces menziesii]
MHRHSISAVITRYREPLRLLSLLWMTQKHHTAPYIARQSVRIYSQRVRFWFSVR